MGCGSSTPAVSTTGGAAASAPPQSTSKAKTKSGPSRSSTSTPAQSKTKANSKSATPAQSKTNSKTKTTAKSGPSKASVTTSATQKTSRHNNKTQTKSGTSPSSVATSTTKPSPPLSDFQMKLNRIRKNDPAVLHFQGCWGDDMTEKEAIQLLSALSENKTIKSIEFCSNKNLGIKFCAAMARLLEQNHEFAVVSLRSNPNFGDEGIKLLCQGLEKNARVHDFYIDGCGFGEAGAVMIGKMLSFNRKLFRLDVSNNTFTSAGVDFIAEGVIENGKWGGGLLQVKMEPLENYDYTAAQAVEAAMLQNKRCMFIVPREFEDQFNFEAMNNERKHLYDGRRNGLRTKYGKLF